MSWLSGLLSAEIFQYQHRWMRVQMPPLTAENSHFLRSGSHGAALVMWPGGLLQVNLVNELRALDLETHTWHGIYLNHKKLLSLDKFWQKVQIWTSAPKFIMEPTTVGSLWLENDLHENELEFESHMGRSKKNVRVTSDGIHAEIHEIWTCVAPAGSAALSRGRKSMPQIWVPMRTEAMKLGV